MDVAQALSDDVARRVNLDLQRLGVAVLERDDRVNSPPADEAQNLVCRREARRHRPVDPDSGQQRHQI